MSDPATILAVLAGGLQIASGFSKAAALERQAKQAEAIGRENADRQRRDVRRLLGIARANVGASGVGIEGSPLDVLADSAAEGELEALSQKFTQDVRASNFRSQKSGAILGGFVGAGTTLTGSGLFDSSPQQTLTGGVNRASTRVRDPISGGLGHV